MKKKMVVGFGGYKKMKKIYEERNMGIKKMINEKNEVMGREKKGIEGRVKEIEGGLMKENRGDYEEKKVIKGNKVR